MNRQIRMILTVDESAVGGLIADLSDRVNAIEFDVVMSDAPPSSTKHRVAENNGRASNGASSSTGDALERERLITQALRAAKHSLGVMDISRASGIVVGSVPWYLKKLLAAGHVVHVGNKWRLA